MMSETQIDDTLAAGTGKAEDMPPGYKRTEVGVIPEDWKVERLGKIVPLAYGKGLPAGQRNQSGDIPVFGSNGIVDHHDSALTDEPTIVIGRKGTAGAVHFSPIPCWPIDTTFFFSSSDPTLVKFRYYALSALDLEGADSESAVPGLNRSSAHSCAIPYPPLPEQRAIAEALSDVDSLLESLDALIAKKQAIKKATMQQLLAGKTRLPRFSGRWETKRLGEVASIRSGATPSTEVSAYWNGSVPWCTPTDITNTTGKYLLKTERSITTTGLASCGASLLPVGAILLCSRATIGEVKIATSPICTNQGFKSLVCKPSVSNEFLYYLLLTLKPRMIERATGSTFLEIGKQDVASIITKLPVLEEQQAIATVLSEIDAEITALEQRRDKCHTVKQGMMQQLLTGRVRLT